MVVAPHDNIPPTVNQRRDRHRLATFINMITNMFVPSNYVNKNTATPNMRGFLPTHMCGSQNSNDSSNPPMAKDK